MSAPDTNTERQKDKHSFPLRVGIILPVAFAVTLLVVFIAWQFLGGQSPQGADVQVDGRTGTATETAPPAASPVDSPASN